MTQNADLGECFWGHCSVSVHCKNPSCEHPGAMTPNADKGWQERALDLADHIRLVAPDIPSAITQIKLMQAASSLEWQVRWDAKHPSPIASEGTGA